MNKERLEWVMSGLNQHALTKTEDQFLKTALEDFDKNQALTEHQEERLETLYKEKSKLIPNKNLPIIFLLRKAAPKKTKPRKPRGKACFDDTLLKLFKENNPGGSSDSDRAGESGTEILRYSTECS